MSKPDIRKISEDLEASLRTIGVYVDCDDMQWVDPTGGMDEETVEDKDEQRHGAKKTSYVVIMPGYIGDVAFSSRVQDPQQYDMDEQFRLMATELRKETYDDKRDEIRKSLDDL